jgi:hypothetical protein
MRNIVVICLDTVRKDYFDNYAIRLKDKSESTFNQCRAASSWTTPSHGSMFSGELPHQHHVHTHDRKFDKLNQSETFLAELSNEYTTIGLSANVHAGPAFGFETLFDKFSSVIKQSYFQDGLDIRSFVSGYNQTGIGLYQKWLRTIARHEYPVKSFFNGLIKRLDSLSAQSSLPKLLDDGAKRITRHTKSMIRGSTEPIFAFLNLMDAHPSNTHMDTRTLCTMSLTLGVHSDSITGRFDEMELLKKILRIYSISKPYIEQLSIILIVWLPG